ncbi:MAG: peptidoglycan DD-metalloendopeptidase family protein [PVC group bacterium]|nr:peptidoglycan DD-metalloendopeptidase family protein [PVC group bacterium]
MNTENKITSFKDEAVLFKDKHNKIIVYSLVLGLFLSGCSTPHKRITSRPEPTIYIKTDLPGTYHSVKRGETLWRISRIYQIDLSMLVDFNKIPNASKLKIGQKIFIPDSLRQTNNIKASDDFDEHFYWPTKGTIASYFSQIKQHVKNQGIDIYAKHGAPVYAATHGKVIFTSNNMRGYGRTIIIKHNNLFSSVYSSNKENIVTSGDYVTQGQVIAYAGTSGRTNQCIVHFELRKNNKPQNPLYYLP